MSEQQPTKLEGSNDLEKFKNLSSLNHKKQVIWCLNALWDRVGEEKAETWWKWYHKFVEFDLGRKADGCELDELNAHRFYEFFKNTHTVKELRDKLREIGWDRRPMMFPFCLVATLEYGVDWKFLVNAPQGDNSEAIAEAQRLLDEATAALDAAAAAADAAADAAAEAARTAAAAAESARIAEEKAETARVAEAPLKAAEEEVKAALAEVQAQESARDKKTKELTELSNGTGVKAGKAKQELAQHLGEDPLPLRKAKITLEAANRKAEKLRAPFKAAREAAEAAAEAAEADRLAAEAAAQDALDKADAAEAARLEAESKVAECKAELEELMNASGSPMGLLWWMARELEEAQKYGKRKK